jgi:Rieske Fe-S protein
MKWAIHGMNALFAAVLGIPAVAYLIDPRNRPARPKDFRTVARLSELPVGVPVQVTVKDVRRDAWTLHTSDVIGRVWLIRREGDRVDAFTTICPHLGCSINFEPTAKLFICPCHNGCFDLQGQLAHMPGMNNPAPRGMDSLEVVLEPVPNAPAEDYFVKVKYQNFEQMKPEKIVKA